MRRPLLSVLAALAASACSGGSQTTDDGGSTHPDSGSQPPAGATVTGPLGFTVKSTAWGHMAQAGANTLLFTDVESDNCADSSGTPPVFPDRDALFFQLGTDAMLHPGTIVMDNSSGPGGINTFLVQYRDNQTNIVGIAASGGAVKIDSVSATALVGSYSMTFPDAGTAPMAEGTFNLGPPCGAMGAEGGDCFLDTDCSGGLICNLSTSTCVHPPVSQCNALTQNCLNGKACVIGHDSGHTTFCVTPGTTATGQSCLAEAQSIALCTKGSQCVHTKCAPLCRLGGGSPGCSSGTCTADPGFLGDGGVGYCP